MNERPGSGDPDVLYQQITSSSDEAIKVALGLVDDADKAAHKMVAECETLLQAVREGTEQIRSELREKMVEFATVMRDYSERIAAKNTAYVESTRKTIDVISSHIETVRAAMKAVAPERAQIAAPDAHIEKGRSDLDLDRTRCCSAQPTRYLAK
jgi:methyl-accepting chemotaxis protein